MNKLLPFLISCIITFSNALAQDSLVLNLSDAIEMAQTGSIASRQIKTNFQSSYWAYRAYRASRSPEVALSGNLPNFNRSINAQILPDGRQEFVSTNTISNDIGLNFSQPIPASGGEVFVNSGIQRIDNIDSDIQNPTSYFTNPVTIGFRQSIFAFNNFKWDQKSAPLEYEEASRQQAEQMENLAINVVRSYFNYLLSQENYNIAENNLQNNEQLYKIAKGRYELGKIAENDLLQMELSVLQASNNLETSKIDLQRTRNDLMTLLSINNSETLNLIVPSSVPDFAVDPDKAVSEARTNRKDIIAFRRQQIEADRRVAQTKAERKLQMDLFGSFGLNKTAFELDQAYNNPLDQERFNLGIRIPIYDGGSRKSAYKIAKSEMELTYADIEQQQLAFEREVRLKALEIKVLKDQLSIAARSDSIAAKRYLITRQRYLIGKIDITELNLALNSKDQARRSYIAALKSYWEAYYGIRQLTLYDFRTNRKLYRPEEEDE